MRGKTAERLAYAAALPLLMAAGLFVRKMHGMAPDFFNTYFPDAAWTMTVYCGVGFLFARGEKLNFPAALLFSYLIEISQLFSPAFLVAARSTRIGGLIFGYGFLWSDILCYTVGAALCFATEKCIRNLIRKGA